MILVQAHGGASACRSRSVMRKRRSGFFCLSRSAVDLTFNTDALMMWSPMSRSTYILRITLCDAKPPIWRRLAAPSDITLGQLHDLIQTAMGWTNSHLHQFILKEKTLAKKSPALMAQLASKECWEDILTAARGVRIFTSLTTPFGDPTDMDGEDENAVTLGEVCPQVKSKLIYEYDFGDGWEHVIEVQKIVPASAKDDLPKCLAGKRACPPEDCGGVWGYSHLLEVIADPKHEEHDDLIEWLNDDFDPEALDIDEVNEMLAEWRDQSC